jgi:hypothetical protein
MSLDTFSFQEFNALVAGQGIGIVVLLGVCIFLNRRCKKAEDTAEEERTERRAAAKELNDAYKQYIPILLNVTMVLEAYKNAIPKKE